MNVRAYLTLMAVAVMLVPMVTVGYAVTYSATTTSANNTVSASYFTVGIYSMDDFDPTSPIDIVAYDPDDFTQLTTDILNGSISYEVVNNSNYIKEDDYVLASGNIYVVIDSVNMGDRIYSISVSAEFRDNGTVMTGIIYGIYLGDFDDVVSPSDTFQSQTAYRMQLDTTFPNMLFTGPITCTVTVSAIAGVINNNGVFTGIETCPMTVIENDPIIEQVTVTGGGGASGDYSKISSTINGCPQVQIINSTNSMGGVADSNGNISVSLDIPQNTPFCVKIWNKESYDIRANITINNIVINGSTTSHTYNNQKLGAGFARYFCHYTVQGTYSSSTYWSTTNLNNIKNNDGWLYSSSGNVTITINGQYNDGHGNTAQNIMLYVVFRDNVTT